MSKKLLYFEPIDSCGEHTQLKGAKSHEELLKENALVGIAYLVDEITGEEWGDDWNDRPACCNASPPYKERCKGLIIKKLYLGKNYGLSKKSS